MESVIGDIRNENAYWYDQIVQALGGGSAAGENPWWATNSAFALVHQHLDRVFPSEQPNFHGTYSFPQFMSVIAQRLAIPDGSGNAQNGGWWNYWGVDSWQKWSYEGSWGYSWFDFIGDMMRSNMIANSAISTNELSTWAAETGADYVDEFSSDTNKVAIGHSITNGLDDLISEITDTSDGAHDEASDMFAQFDFTEMFPSSFTGADPQLMIFPESTIGGVHVGNVVGTIALPLSVSVWVRRVAEFCYGCLLFVSVLRLTKTEYAYWTSLGNTEGADA